LPSSRHKASPVSSSCRSPAAATPAPTCRNARTSAIRSSPPSRRDSRRLVTSAPELLKRCDAGRRSPDPGAERREPGGNHPDPRPHQCLHRHDRRQRRPDRQDRGGYRGGDGRGSWCGGGGQIAGDGIRSGPQRARRHRRPLDAGGPGTEPIVQRISPSSPPISIRSFRRIAARCATSPRPASARRSNC